MAAQFTADLNPKTNASGLTDLLKMDEAISKAKLYKDALAAKDASTVKTPPKPNNMVKSSADDVGTPFRFNNSQNVNDYAD
jgi:hypothetical protein